MLALIPTILSLIGAVVPLLGALGGNSAVIETIVSALAQLVPIITTDGQEFLGPVQSLIAALRQSGSVTPAQMEQLQAMDAACDAAFDAAAKDAGV